MQHKRHTSRCPTHCPGLRRGQRKAVDPIPCQAERCIATIKTEKISTSSTSCCACSCTATGGGGGGGGRKEVKGGVPCSPALNLQEPGVYQVCDGAYDDPSSYAPGAETDDADDEDGGDEVDAYVCEDVLFMLSSGTTGRFDVSFWAVCFSRRQHGKAAQEPHEGAKRTAAGHLTWGAAHARCASAAKPSQKKESFSSRLGRSAQHGVVGSAGEKIASFSANPDNPSKQTSDDICCFQAEWQHQEPEASESRHFSSAKAKNVSDLPAVRGRWASGCQTRPEGT